jgi:hypothetical protein
MPRKAGQWENVQDKAPKSEKKLLKAGRLASMQCPELQCPELQCPELQCPELQCPELQCPELQP